MAEEVRLGGLSASTLIGDPVRNSEDQDLAKMKIS